MRTLLIVLGVMAALPFATGCASSGKVAGMGISAYVAAREATNPGLMPQPSTEEAEEAMEQFIAFYQVYDADVIRADIRKVYADNAYFRDPFHEMTGVDAMEAYFLNAAEPVNECTFEILSWSESDGEYFIPWIMRLNLKNDPPDLVTETLGLTHLRLNEEGRVVFQADYWDPSEPVYGRIPVLGRLTRTVRGRIAGDE